MSQCADGLTAVSTEWSDGLPTERELFLVRRGAVADHSTEAPVVALVESGEELRRVTG